MNHPVVGDLKMPAVGFAVADRRHDARWFARFDDDHDLVRVCSSEIGLDEVVAAAFRSLRNRDVPFLRPPFQPALKLLGNVAQRVPAHRVKLPVGVEEADDTLRLLEGLNQPVQQDAIKAPVMPSILRPLATCGTKGYQGQSPWLVGG